MRKFAAIIIIMLGLLPQAQADWGQQYILGKAGLMDFDINDTDVDPMLSFGLLYGFGLTREMSLEFEYNQGLIGGDYTADQDEGKYGIWTMAGYGSYRLPLNDTMYVKIKGGLLYESINRDSTAEVNQDDTATGLGAAGGIGVGVLAGQVLTLELELTAIDEDVLFLSFGAHYAF